MMLHNTVTIDGESYDIVVIDGNIVLQGLNRDFEITHGWHKLLDECRETVRYSEGPLFVSQSVIEDMANEWLSDFAKRNYKEAVIIEHNLN